MAEFSYASAMDVGLGALGGLAQAYGARAQAQAAMEIEEANNSVARSSSMLARTIQNINNRRLLERGGANLATATRQFQQAADIGVRQGFESSIQQAEMMGRAGIAAAAAGLGGGLIGTASSVAQLSVARQRDYANRDRENRTYEQLQAMTNIMPDAIRSMQSAPLVAQQSYGAQAQGKPSTMSYLLAGLLSKKDSLHTMLGSMAGGTKAESVGLGEYGVTGTPLAPLYGQVPSGGTYSPVNYGATSHAVPDQSVYGTALAPIRIN